MAAEESAPSPLESAQALLRLHKGAGRDAAQAARRHRRLARLADQQAERRSTSTPARQMLRAAGLAAAYR